MVNQESYFMDYEFICRVFMHKKLPEARCDCRQSSQRPHAEHEKPSALPQLQSPINICTYISLTSCYYSNINHI